MNSNEINPVVRFDWSMGVHAPGCPVFREVNLAEIVDVFSQETLMELIEGRERLIAFVESGLSPRTIHVYEGAGVLNLLQNTRKDPNTRSIINRIHWFVVRLFEGKISSEYCSSENGFKGIAWCIEHALEGGGDDAYEAGMYLKALERDTLAEHFFELAGDHPSALYQRYLYSKNEDLLVQSADGCCWQACNELGVRSAKRGIFTDAVERFNQVDAQGVLAYNHAQLLRKSGHLRVAEEYYQRAWKEGFTPAGGNLAVLLFNRGSQEEALTYFRNAVHTKDDHVRKNYARALEAQGEFQKAAAQWKVLGDVSRQIKALQQIGSPPEKRSRIELKFDERFFKIDEAEPLTNYIDK